MSAQTEMPLLPVNLPTEDGPLMGKLKRSIESYLACSPKAMAHEMSDNAKMFAFEDMREDVLTLARLLCEAGYPRRGTIEETQTMLQFGTKVQEVITHAEAVELS